MPGSASAPMAVTVTVLGRLVPMGAVIYRKGMVIPASEADGEERGERSRLLRARPTADAPNPDLRLFCKTSVLLCKICRFCLKIKRAKIWQDSLAVFPSEVCLRVLAVPNGHGAADRAPDQQSSRFVWGWHSGPAKHWSSAGNSRNPSFAVYL